MSGGEHREGGPARPPRRRRWRLLLAAVLVLAGAALVAVAVDDKLRYGVWLRVPAARAVLEDPQSSTVPRAAVPPAGTGAVEDGLRWGLATPLLGFGDPDARARRVREAGVRWIRVAARWDEVERVRGRDDWRALDAQQLAAARRGIRVLHVAEDPPGWARPVQRRYPRDPAPYARFAVRLAQRYGPDGTFWRAHPELDARLAVAELEVLNEPWVRVFGDGSDADPRRYARLVRATGAALRRHAPRTRILVAMESSWLEPDGYQRPWIEPMFDEVPELGRYIDGVAVHPYSYRSPLQVTPGIPRTDFRRLRDVQRLLAAEGVRDRPLWITEIGFTSCAPGTASRCLTEAGQARAVRDLFVAVRRHPEWRIVAAFLYALDDGPGSATEPEQRFGIVRPDGTPKPAYEAWRRGVAAWPRLQDAGGRGAAGRRVSPAGG